jgi:hypothetical protein
MQYTFTDSVQIYLKPWYWQCFVQEENGRVPTEEYLFLTFFALACHTGKELLPCNPASKN